MVKGDIIHGHYHKALAKEINRVLVECRNLGIFISKKDATAIVAMKSKRGVVNKEEIITYIKRLEKVIA